MDVLFPQQGTENNMHVIKVIGVGGGGVNAVDAMITARVADVDFFAVNTDAAQLRRCKAENRIQLGQDGKGVSGDPQKGKACAEESEAELRDMLSGADMVFITTGMGGGTGTGASPVIAKFAKEAGILTVGVVTKPFKSEGPERVENAKRGIKEIRQYVDALIVIPNDRIYTVIDRKTPIDSAYIMTTDTLRVSIESITDIITKTGYVNVDFSDVKRVLKDSENAVIGLGEDEDCQEAFKKALTNVYAEGPDIKEADSILINISTVKGNSACSVEEMEKIDDSIIKDFEKKPTVKKGMMFSDVLDNRIKISVVASFKKQGKEKQDLFDYIDDDNRDCSADASEQTKDLIEKLSVKPAILFWKPKRLKNRK